MKKRLLSIIIAGCMAFSSTVLFENAVWDNSDIHANALTTSCETYDASVLTMIDGGIEVPAEIIIDELNEDVDAHQVSDDNINSLQASQSVMSKALSKYAEKSFSNYPNGNNMLRFYLKLEMVIEDIWYSNNTLDKYYEVDFSQYGLTPLEAKCTFVILRSAQPMLFFIETIGSLDTKLYLFTHEDFIGMTSNKRRNLDARIQNYINKFSDAENKFTLYDQALYIHDKLITMTDYAFIPGTLTPQTTNWTYSILGLVDRNSGICEGYSRTYQLLVNFYGGDCTYTDGKTLRGEHAWNICLMDDEMYYYIDTTWDDPTTGIIDKPGNQLRHKYFAVGTNTMYIDHTPNSHSLSNSLPSASESIWSFHYKLPYIPKGNYTPVLKNPNNTIQRLSGSTRYKTAAEISKKTFDKADTVILAYSMNYADALAGVPLAYKYNAPILLTNNNQLDTSTLSEIKRLGAKNIIILGGKGAISKNVVNELTKNGIAETNIKRFEGKTRFGTACAVAKELNPNPTDIFFVYAFDFADALSISTIAALKNAPIIYLKTSGEVDEETSGYLASIKGKVKNAYIIGGKGIISDKMLNKAVQACGANSAKRISGSNRFKTCIAVNEYFKNILNGNMICVATGMNYPDALAGGVYAAKNRSPMFLINSEIKTPVLLSEQKAYLKANKPSIITALGGSRVVSLSYISIIAKYSVYAK